MLVVPPYSVIAAKPADAVAAAPRPHRRSKKVTFQKSYDGTAVSDWRCEL